jgi:NitT/TauT family transport system substrate-binding protein
VKGRRWYLAGIGVAAVAALSTAGFALAGSSSPSSPDQKLTKVTIQLKWVTQAQFAGYYAAKAKGYYKAAGLDVTLKVGGPDIVNEQTVLSKQAEFGVNWFPALLASRDQGNDLVNIAQVFPRSGTTEVTWRKDGITNFRKMRGKKFGVWIFGNEFEQRAALVKYGMNPDKDVTLVKQNFDMLAFLNHEIDAASAMTYNELAQVLETKNPDTGKLYTMKDLRVYKYNDLGTGMLQDGIFVRGDWIKDAANQATAVKFLEASFKGWIYCRDHYKACVNIVLANGPALPRGHQTWQMNEVNALIWPNRLGIGLMNPVDYAKTAKISLTYKVIKKPATKASYRTDIARKALANLRRQGVDVSGNKWKKAVVILKEKGK